MDKSQAEQDQEFMKKALQQAKLALEDGEVPIGAVVVAGGRIIARAHNQVERLRDTTAHAEMIAITSAADFLGSKYLDECTLYITLEPCIMCAGAIAWSHLGRLVIGALDERNGYQRLGGRILHPKTEVVTKVLGQESEILLRTFFSSRRS